MQYRYRAQFITNDNPPPIEAQVVEKVEVTWPDTLSREQMTEVLDLAEWPHELDDEALAVSYCESKWSRWAVNGVMLGPFQLSDANNGWQGWWNYFGFDSSNYSDPVYAAKLALLVYNYDIEHGQPPWTQWNASRSCWYGR